MLLKYRVKNTTKDEWFYVWSEIPPTEDPNNPTDAIDTDSIAIVDKEATPTASGQKAITISFTSGTVENIIKELSL